MLLLSKFKHSYLFLFEWATKGLNVFCTDTTIIVLLLFFIATLFSFYCLYFKVFLKKIINVYEAKPVSSTVLVNYMLNYIRKRN